MFCCFVSGGRWGLLIFLADLLIGVCGLLVVRLVVGLGVVADLVTVVAFMVWVVWLCAGVLLYGLVMLRIFFWFGKGCVCVCILLVACFELTWFRICGC